MPAKRRVRRQPKKSKLSTSECISRGALGILVCLCLVFAVAFAIAFSIAVVYALNLISYNTFSFALNSFPLLSLPIAAVLYLVLYKRQDGHSMLTSLGLSRQQFSIGKIGIGIILAFAILVFTTMVGLIGIATNTPVNTNIGILLSGAPVWFLFFTAVIEPINEEIFFRGLMVPRLGIIVSAIIFSLGHVGYDSTFEIEVIAALIFGILAGYAYRKTNSLYPSIIAHILINVIAVIGFASGMG